MLKPRCYFCGSHTKLRLQQFYVKVAGKLVLERHRVCEVCEKTHLKGYH